MFVTHKFQHYTLLKNSKFWAKRREIPKSSATGHVPKTVRKSPASNPSLYSLTMQHTKVPLCVSKANLGLLLQFCFLDAMFTYL